MKKLKILVATLMVAGIMTGVSQNAFAAVDNYIVKDAVSGKLYQYDSKDIISSSNNKLSIDFANNSKINGIYMIHDDETEKYISYENVKNVIENKNNEVDLNQICKTVQGENVPFYVYKKVIKNDEIQNEINFTKNDLELDFNILQLKESGDLHISGNNPNISNLECSGDVIIKPTKNGQIILKDIKGKNIKIVSGKANKINLVNVKADSLEIESNLKVCLMGNTVIKNSTVKEGSEIQTEGLATIEKVSIDTKDKEARVKLDGNFGEVQVDKTCNLELSNVTKVERLNAVSDVILKGDSSVRIRTLVGIGNIKNENGSIVASKEDNKSDTTTSKNKTKNEHHKSIKSNDGGAISTKSNTGEVEIVPTHVDNTSIKLISKEEQKPDITTQASKHDENKPATGGEGKSSTSGSAVVNLSNGEIVVAKPQLQLGVVDVDKSSILNIHYINYGIIVLQQGCYADYNFYMDGDRVQVQAVNKEGTVVKIELKDRNPKKITVEKGNEKEDIILKYKEVKF